MVDRMTQHPAPADTAEQRITLAEWQVDDILRRHLKLPDAAEIIRQINGTILVVWKQ